MIGAQLLLGCASGVKQTDPEKYRIIHNNDGSDLLGNLWYGKRPLSVADLDSCVDMVANSQVTTYMMCSGSDFFYVDSEYGHVMGDDLNGTLDCGCDTAAYNNFTKYYRNYLNLKNEGTDLVRATLARAKEKGMEAFITYRMNDLHFNDTTTHCPIYYTDFWIKHPEYWLNDTTIGYLSGGAFDFSHKEVRDRKLDIINEQLERYEMIDGYDLDFMRFIVYFKSGEGRKNAYLITEMLKEVRKKVDYLSAKRGKKILLSARVASTVDQNLEKGLDVREWLRLGLLDFISTGVHWRGDPAMPVAQFREELGNDLNIPFYSSIDDGGLKPRETWSHGQLRGMASHILSQGADGLYLFNYYLAEWNSLYNRNVPTVEGGMVCRVRVPGLLQELGSLETLKGRNKIYSLSDEVVQYRIRNNSPLPISLTKGARKSFDMFVGDKVEELYPEEAILFLRTSVPANYSIYVNGRSASCQIPAYTKLYDKELGISGDQKEYAFQLPKKVLKQGINTIEIESSDENDFALIRTELALKYGDVQTHGYF